MKEDKTTYSQMNKYRAYDAKYAIFIYIGGKCVGGHGEQTQKHVKETLASLKNNPLVELISVYDQRNAAHTFATDYNRESKGWKTYKWDFEKEVH